VDDFDVDGFAVVEQVIADGIVGELIAALAQIERARSERHRGGIRNLLQVCPEVRRVAESPGIRGLVLPALGPAARPVRGILFDKTPDANWKVPWHQDLTIAVRERIEVEGYGPWSVKAGVLHVQPPVAILERMLAVRIHLDDCAKANGALRVLPGSHRDGRLTDQQIDDMRQSIREVCSEVPRCGALLIRPLLLHSSSPAEVGSPAGDSHRVRRL
jgi:ectoine hydroxylase-related dioxygenase (phytanoyl-CoA dioxygenase family)